MNSGNIIKKLKKANLLGRGGAAFPTALKWDQVLRAKAKKKYIICNASEGEPGVFKDGFILENYPAEVIEGIKIALKTIDNSSAFIYLRKDYYQRLKKILEKLIGNQPITLFKKTGGYIAGEETSICEAIEGKKPEPRMKPPFVSQSGLWGYPTLVNNVETFYHVARIAKGLYKRTRFYSISGDIENKGVYELPEDRSVSRLLKETKNFPDFDFFVQVGGAVCGAILLPDELNKPVCGAGAIVVYDRKKTDLISLMKGWAEFFHTGNCDKCVPCREGTYRILKMMEGGKIDKDLLEDFLFVLKETSFCALGKGVPTPFEGVIAKLLK